MKFGFLLIVLANFNCVSQIKDLNYLDSMLSNKYCNNEFDYDSVYFLPDYGCFFDANKQNIGLVNVFLIPKSKLKNRKVNLTNKSVDWIKDNFNVIIFLTEKKYLVKIITGEGRFAEKFPYIRKMYTYNNSISKWQLKKSYIIKSLTEQRSMSKLMWEIVFKLAR